MEGKSLSSLLWTGKRLTVSEFPARVKIIMDKVIAMLGTVLKSPVLRNGEFLFWLCHSLATFQ